jgi:hypothetical protein
MPYDATVMKTNPAVIAALAALAMTMSVESARLTQHATRVLRPAVVRIMSVHADEVGPAVKAAAHAATAWIAHQMKS